MRSFGSMRSYLLRFKGDIQRAQSLDCAFDPVSRHAGSAWKHRDLDEIGTPISQSSLTRSQTLHCLFYVVGELNADRLLDPPIFEEIIQ